MKMNITNWRRREDKLQWKVVVMTDSIITYINLMERGSYFWRNMGLPLATNFFYSTSFEHMCVTGPNYYFSFGHHPSFFSQKDKCGQV
jgi:hypothetical protein